VKIGPRPGDAAEMAYLELVDEEYVATQREERTPEPVPAVPVEATEEPPETEEEALEDVDAAEEELADDVPGDEPTGEADQVPDPEGSGTDSTAAAEAEEPASDDTKS
jgi:hypothetical protein